MKGRGFAWTGITIFIVQTVLLAVIIIIAINYNNNTFSDVPVPYQNAIKHMNKTDLSYYDNTISKIHQGESEQDVEMTLGKPKRVKTDNGFLVYGYDCPKPSIAQCGISILFKNNNIISIQWWNDFRFWFRRDFTDLDKVYVVDGYDFMLTLQSGWDEQTFTEQDLKEWPSAPKYAYLKNNNPTGILYVSPIKLTNKFDIQDFISQTGLGQPTDGVKEYTIGNTTYYQFKLIDKKNNFTYQFMPVYFPTQGFVIDNFYVGPTNKLSNNGLNEAFNIVQTMNISKVIQEPVQQDQIYVKVLATDKTTLDKWYTTKTDVDQFFPYIGKVKGGQAIYFPIFIANPSFNADGKAIVSATISSINPNGKEIYRKDIPNIADGIPQSSKLLFIQTNGQIYGDNFTSNTNPEDYPLGMYTINVKITDTISGKTINQSIQIEKIN